MNQPKNQLVIVGGGFAGVYTARFLHRRLPADWEIILFSQENHFIFTPLLGDVVGSSINPMHVVWPIRQMARHVTCKTAAITAIDLHRREVIYRTANGATAGQPYAQLVLACGAAVNLDIIPGMAAHGLPLKTMGDALMLRNHLIGQLEKAEVESDADRRHRLLAVTVVGAGFSGVEVAGEINDLLRASARFFTTIQPSAIQVTLLEARDRILPELPPSLAAFATRKMSRHGITICTGAKVQSVTDQGVHLQDGTLIEAGTIVCTIGATANPLIAALGLPLVNKRLKTAPDMRVEGPKNLWAIGDCAAVPNAYDHQIAPPTGQVAVRQARQLAANIRRVIAGQETHPFYFRPLGMLAAIGNHKAVGVLLGLKISGFLAWFIWRGIYLSKMPTLARKVQIAFDWAWQLFFPRDLVQLKLDTTERFARAHFEKGQFVFHKGESGERFFVIERGKAGVYLDETTGPVVLLGPGEHFGEGALLRGTTRSASVRAEEALDLLCVGRTSFAQLTGRLEVLRSALERSVHGSRSAAALLSIAKEHLQMNTQLVRAAMSQPVCFLPFNLTFAEALKQSQEMGKGGYPIVDEQGRLVGICTRTDFYKALQQLRQPETPLAEIMHQPVQTVREVDTLTTALLAFVRQPIKRLVVVAADDPTKPVGMLTPFDILQVLGQLPKVPTNAATQEKSGTAESTLLAR